MDRRGQGISINVIVIAAIALLTLVILSVLVLRGGGSISRGTSCEQLGGACRSTTDTGGGNPLAGGNPCGDDSGETYNRGGTCQKNSQDESTYCCIRV